MGLSDILVDFDPGGRRTDNRMGGVMRAEVTEVIDSLMCGRVRVSIPSLGIEPWAPVCAPFAGKGYGLWCMPQVGDTVIIAFEHGDPELPVVLGSIWTSAGDPPIEQPLDAQFTRVLKTPGGHALIFDDLKQTITLTHTVGHEIALGAAEITISLAQGMGSVTLKLDGSATVSGKTSAKVTSPRTTVAGDVTVDVKGATATVAADATLRISGSLVTLN